MGMHLCMHACTTTEVARQGVSNAAMQHDSIYTRPYVHGDRVEPIA